MVLLLVLGLVSVPVSKTYAVADTVDVAATPAGNINTVINGDTTTSGARNNPDRFYRLKRGSVYQVTEPIKVNGDLHIIATEGTTRPPVLAPAILTDNSSIDHFFNFVGADANITINDLYLLSVRSDQQTLGWSAGIRVNNNHISLKLRGVVFEAFSEAGIRIYANWTKLDVQDCNFRNHQHGTSYFGGQPFMTDAPNHLDTVKFINNTFIANNAYLWSVRGYDVYSLFEHNTVIYGIVNPFLIRQGSHLHLRDNIFYAMHSYGGIPDHMINAWFLNYPDTVSSGIIHIRTRDTVSSYYYYNGASAITGPEAYVDESNGVTSDMLLPEGRVYEISHNSYYWPQELKDFYKTWNDTVATIDTIETTGGGKYGIKRYLYFPTWMTDYCKNITFDSLLAGKAKLQISDNNETDPEFNSTVNAHITNVIDYIRKIANGTLDNPWHWPTTGSLYPPAWPLTEDLAYSNTAMQSAGHDGFALGDLNWFPTQKDNWFEDLTGVVKDPGSLTPDTYSLSEAYPNPFNPETNIKFNIAKSGTVRLVVYNILGQKVRTLLNDEVTAGQYTAKWDGRDEYGMSVSSGVYFFQLESGSFNMTKKMVLMK